MLNGKLCAELDIIGVLNWKLLCAELDIIGVLKERLGAQWEVRCSMGSYVVNWTFLECSTLI